MNDSCTKICPVRLAIKSIAEAALVAASVVALAFGLERAAEYRAGRPVTADASGQIVLGAPQATLHGTLELVPQVLEKQQSDFDYWYGRKLAEERSSRTVSHWSEVNDSVAWQFQTPVAGQFEVEVQCAAGPSSAGGEFEVAVGGQRLTAAVPATGGETAWSTVRVGRIRIGPGVYSLTVKPLRLAGETLMGLKSVVLKPAAGASG